MYPIIQVPLFVCFFL